MEVSTTICIQLCFLKFVMLLLLMKNNLYGDTSLSNACVGVAPVWELIHGTTKSALKRCTFLNPNTNLLQNWFNVMAAELAKPGLKRGWGKLGGDKRAAIFYTKDCRCSYQFGKATAFPGTPFPPILFEILRHVMPVCNINSHSLWPNAAHVNWYSDG